MSNPIKTTAITANLTALQALLQEATSRVGEATGYAAQGESLNTIVGTVMGLEQHLDAAQKLLGAALALHRA